MQNESKNKSTESTNLNRRFLVILIDAATPDEEKYSPLSFVLAGDPYEACELAQTAVEAECGEGYFPILAFSEDELKKLHQKLVSSDLSVDCPCRKVS